MQKLVSAIIPVYNEEKTIGDCLKSLFKQTYKSLEIILIDDGSTDQTPQLIKRYREKNPSIPKIVILNQNHKGPGTARNLGAKYARGEILVFVDADMTFDKNFIKDLITPITEEKTIGTFSKNEMNANKDNIWSVCWNINRVLPLDRLIPSNYPNEAPVFRAILKKEFGRVGGFETSGQYTDDWSLSRKLGLKSNLAQGAIYYHSNPSTLGEVWGQARWIGKNEFISGTLLRRIKSTVRYSLPLSMLIGLFKSLITFNLNFLIFKVVYDLAIFTSVLKSFTGESKAK